MSTEIVQLRGAAFCLASPLVGFLFVLKRIAEVFGYVAVLLGARLWYVLTLLALVVYMILKKTDFVTEAEAADIDESIRFGLIIDDYRYVGHRLEANR